MQWFWWLTIGGIGLIAMVKKLSHKESDSEPTKTHPLFYRPGSVKQINLFKEAAKLIGVPEEWASSKALSRLLQKESGGWVGRPNYTYGERAKDRTRWQEVWEELKSGIITAKSSATGLGQLLTTNVKKYYPSGLAGIGNPIEEAAGMLAYIKARYGNPDKALAFHDDPNKKHEGY